MDWSRTKTIFIAVFLILDIFLYSLYVNRYNEGRNIEIPGEKTIEAYLKEDNISYVSLPNNIEEASYITGKVHHFKLSDFPDANLQTNLLDDTKVRVILNSPVKLSNTTDSSKFTEFVQANVKDGEKYSLWDIDQEKRTATFFQKVNNRILYYNKSGILTLNWNNNNEIYMYEQTMIDNIEEMGQQENVLPPLKVIEALYAKGLLKVDSRITQMKLGYSTLVNLKQKQVLVPTWEVRVKLSEGDIEEYFVNAVEGKMIDIQGEKQEAEE